VKDHRIRRDSSRLYR